MELWETKLLVLFGLFTISSIFGLLPFAIIPPKKSRARQLQDYQSLGGDSLNPKSRKFNTVKRRRCWHLSRRNRKLLVSLVGCFGAGVFLATCFLDLLPEVREMFNDLFDDAKLKTDFPVAEFVACLGFFLILMVEQMVMTVQEKKMERNNPTERSRLDSCASSVYEEEVSRPVQNGEPSESLLRSGSIHSESGSIHRSSRSRLDTTGSIVGIKLDLPEAAPKELTETQEEEESTSPSKLRSLVLLLALSLHSVFEGLAVGLQKKEQEVLKVFAALSVHKSVLAFSLGNNILQSEMETNIAIPSIATFAGASPVGIIIGIIMSTEQNMGTKIASTILQGLATGTFLYITFFEILPAEFNSRRWRMPKTAFLLLGYGLMATMAYIMPA